MRTSVRLALFAEAVAFVFLAAVGVGSAVGSPVEEGAHGAGHAQGAPAARAGVASGLAVSEAGYGLRPVGAPAAAGEQGELRFPVTGPDGAPLRDYDVVHGKQLHLVVVRRDTTSFRHVHPTLGADGTWSIPWTWEQAGSYRVFADFDPAGEQGQVTLGTDVQVAGAYTPQPLPPVSRTATVDGYTVTLTGDLATGATQPLTFTVTRNGRPVTDLQPYLGAYGHLVALRAGDLAYLHVHPDDESAGPVPGPDVRFAAQAPSAATYRLFLDFQHGGTVRTAQFTLDSTTGAATTGAPHSEDGH
jgi:hypothetical protein